MALRVIKAPSGFGLGPAVVPSTSGGGSSVAPAGIVQPVPFGNIGALISPTAAAQQIVPPQYSGVSSPPDYVNSTNTSPPLMASTAAILNGNVPVTGPVAVNTVPVSSGGSGVNPVKNPNVVDSGSSSTNNSLMIRNALG